MQPSPTCCLGNGCCCNTILCVHDWAGETELCLAMPCLQKRIQQHMTSLFLCLYHPDSIIRALAVTLHRTDRYEVSPQMVVAPRARLTSRITSTESLFVPLALAYAFLLVQSWQADTLQLILPGSLHDGLSGAPQPSVPCMSLYNHASLSIHKQTWHIGTHFVQELSDVCRPDLKYRNCQSAFCTMAISARDTTYRANFYFSNNACLREVPHHPQAASNCSSSPNWRAS